MRVNNNTISSNQPVFGNNRTSSSRRAEEKSKIANAYRVEISNMALAMLDEYDDEVEVFNSHILSYNKSLVLRTKYY